MRLLRGRLDNPAITLGVTDEDDDVEFMIFDGHVYAADGLRYDREELPDGRAIHRWRRVMP